MRFFPFLAPLAIATLALTSCTLKPVPIKEGLREIHEYRDSEKWGKVIGRDIDAEKFCMIKTEGAVDVIFTQADSCSIRAYGNEKAIEKYLFTQKGNTLSIAFEDSYKDTLSSIGKDITPAITVYVTAPTIEDIKAYGTGTVTLDNDIVQKRDLNIEINGEGDIETNNLEVSNFTVAINGTGDLDADNVHCAGNIDLCVNGAGDIEANIECVNAKTIVNGTGDIKLDIKCNAITTECNGSGDIKLKGKCNTLNKKDGAVGAIDSRNLDVASDINIK